MEMQIKICLYKKYTKPLVSEELSCGFPDLIVFLWQVYSRTKFRTPVSDRLAAKTPPYWTTKSGTVWPITVSRPVQYRNTTLELPWNFPYLLLFSSYPPNHATPPSWLVVIQSYQMGGVSRLGSQISRIVAIQQLCPICPNKIKK